MIKKQFGFDLKVFRSDNAPELRFTDLFSKMGVLHQYSCVETPQQNSIAERKHQHLLVVARALFFQSRVSISFWGECILMATFLINRLPSSALKNKSPYQMLFNEHPDYMNIKTFGCLCFVSALRARMDKFSKRALPAVFLGYSPGVKGYKVYVLKTRAVIVSRDVIFHENIFPFHTISSTDSIVDSFHNVSLPTVLTDLFSNFSVGVNPPRTYVTGQCVVAQNPIEQHIADQHKNSPTVADQHEADQLEPDQHEPEQHEAGQHAAGQHATGQHEVPEHTEAGHIEVDNVVPVHNSVLHTDNHAEVGHVDNRTEVSCEAPPINNGCAAVSHARASADNVHPRRSTRIPHQPSYLRNYYCGSNSINNVVSPVYPIEDYLSTAKLSSSYKSFVANISSEHEHVFYHQAARFLEWRAAMKEELQAMENNKTWSVVPLPQGKMAIDCKWVFRIKRKADGTVDRYKARLVAKGFT
ncbi:hypothetical protein HRI_004205000 [Hibiscus trionum]|uniref:Integrase catalytic domain-containing protein n=1 Tax=Hibiscus trionum TaxID=183268 RepID=A0A9W7IZF6_HIBTR|nr:hypothetical protein HRI_004205000 [Hibiscus trionum]